MSLAETLRQQAEKADTFGKESVINAFKEFFTKHPQLSISLYDTNLRGLTMDGYEKSKWSASKPIFHQIVDLAKSEGFIWERHSDGFGYIRLY